MKHIPSETPEIPAEPAALADTFEEFLRGSEGYPLETFPDPNDIHLPDSAERFGEARRALAQAAQEIIKSLAHTPEEAALIADALKAILVRDEVLPYLSLKESKRIPIDTSYRYSDDGEHLG